MSDGGVILMYLGMISALWTYLCRPLFTWFSSPRTVGEVKAVLISIIHFLDIGRGEGRPIAHLTNAHKYIPMLGSSIHTDQSYQFCRDFVNDLNNHKIHDQTITDSNIQEVEVTLRTIFDRMLVKYEKDYGDVVNQNSLDEDLTIILPWSNQRTESVFGVMN